MCRNLLTANAFSTEHSQCQVLFMFKKEIIDAAQKQLQTLFAFQQESVTRKVCRVIGKCRNIGVRVLDARANLGVIQASGS
jgi:hypothetical protein